MREVEEEEEPPSREDEGPFYSSVTARTDVPLVLAKRGEQAEDERKRKRQEKFEKIRLLYTPQYPFGMPTPEEDPNALEVVTRVPTVADFQQGRRERDIQERKEKREATNLQRRNSKLYQDSLNTMREIYGDYATKEIVFGHRNDWFLYYPNLFILQGYVRRVEGKYNVEEILTALRSALKVVAGEHNFGANWIQAREKEVGMVLSHQRYFFQELPEVLGEYHQSLLDGNDAELQELLTRIKEEGYPRSFILALYTYLLNFASSTPELQQLSFENKWKIIRNCATTLDIKLGS